MSSAFLLFLKNSCKVLSGNRRSFKREKTWAFTLKDCEAARFLGHPLQAAFLIVVEIFQIRVVREVPRVPKQIPAVRFRGMGKGMVATPYSGWAALPKIACIMFRAPFSFWFAFGKEKAPVCVAIKTTKPAPKTLTILFNKKAPFLKRLRFKKGARLEIAVGEWGNSRSASHQLPENSLWHLWIFQ